MFEEADSAKKGSLEFEDILDMYSRKAWNLSPNGNRGVLSDEELLHADPKELTHDFVDAMDLDGSNVVTYAEFMAYCVGRRRQEVLVNFYDLTNGVAATIPPWLVGKRLEGIWHTGVVVFEKEYYYGGDIFFDSPGKTVFGTPTKTMSFGFTLWRQEELHNFIVDELRPTFNREVYDVIHRNCNHFTSRACEWLTGQRISSEVEHQPENLMQLPAARLLRPLLNRWLGNLEPGKESSQNKTSQESSDESPK
jgi:hypothetical protein